MAFSSRRVAVLVGALLCVHTAGAATLLPHLASPTVVADFTANSEVAVVAFVPDEAAASQAVQALFSMAGRLQGVVQVALVTDRSLLGRCNVDCDSPIVVLTKRGGGDKPTYQGEFSSGLLTRWAASHATPLVAQYKGPQDAAALLNFHKAWQVQLPQLVCVVESSADLTPSVMAELADAAAANDDMKFFVTSREQGKTLLEEVGIPLAAPTPLFYVQYRPNGTAHLRAGVKSLDMLPEFIREYKEGALQEADAQAQTEGRVAEAELAMQGGATHEEL